MVSMYRRRAGEHYRKVPPAVNAGPEFLTDDRRACAPGKGVDPDWFFTEAHAAAAKKVCGRCMFRHACDKYATDRHEKWGVWGGRNRGGMRRRFDDAD